MTSRLKTFPSALIRKSRRHIARSLRSFTWIRFDISFVVSQLARFCASAGAAQWAALHNLMEYLAAHPSFIMRYCSGMNPVDLLSWYAEADWGNSSSRRSTSGMVMLYNKSQIMWKSKMQKTTALSTAEAEYYSALMAGCEVLYLRALLHSLGFAQKKPTQVYEDNTACIEWRNNIVGGRERAKHIYIRKHFAHEVIQIPEWSDESSQGSDIGPDGRHPDQGTTSSASTRMPRWAPSAFNHKDLRDLCSQEGVGRQGY